MTTSNCSVASCTSNVRSKGMCEKHYRKNLKHGNPLYVPPPRTKKYTTCTIGDCTAKNYLRGMCRTHYNRWQKHGDANWQPPLPQWKFLEDIANTSSDECIEWPYRTDSYGYGYLSYKNKGVKAHRLVLFFRDGMWPDKTKHVAHSCNNRSCVNPNHVRSATCQENILDRWEHGTMNNHLTTEAAIEVYNAPKNTKNIELAEQYGVSQGVVSNIRTGRRYNHITGAAKPPEP